MKFAKFISSSLIMATIFNITCPSFASTLSEDGRYETFEGNSIAIDDILEGDEVDVEIEGNTLVNALNYSSISDFLSFTGGTITSDKYIEINADGSKFYNFFMKKESLIAKPSTEYTFFVEIIENTLTMLDGAASYAFIFGDSHNINQPSIWAGNKSFQYNTKPGVYKFTLTTKDNFDSAIVGDRGFINEKYSGKLKFRYMIIEGNHMDKNIPFFNGMKSVGEDTNSINIASESEAYQCREITSDSDRFNYYLKNVIKSGTKITNKSNKIVVLLHYTEGTEAWVKDITLQPNESYMVEDGLDVRVVTFYTFKDWNTNNVPKYLSEAIEIDNGYYDEINIQIKEPLRGLPNGVKDRVLKKNGQWLIERKVGYAEIDGTENWVLSTNSNANNAYFFETFDGLNNKHYHKSETEQIMSDILVPHRISYGIEPSVEFSIGYGIGDTNLWRIYTNDTMNLNEFKEWLSINRPKVVYELKSPFYESLNIGLSVNLHKDTTYISNNSNIPAKMEFTVDRTLNRAKEAIEDAKINPTTQNISIARMWTNLANETLKKDEFQEELNNIVDIRGLEIEKKSATANLDIYIKSFNALSMSLNTNSVVFEGYSGVEDVEKLNAVEITIDSSLPYDLNAYLENNFSNSDSTNTIDKTILNIRESGNLYQAFSNDNNKIVLNNIVSGDRNIHKIDLKLSRDTAHKTDVYKATVKFEAVQK